MSLLNRDTTTPDPPEGRSSGAAPATTSAWASLAHRNYRLFFFGGLVSNTGRWFQSVAIPAIIWQLTESAAWVGLAGFSRMAPMAFVSPLAGALADRYDRRKLLLVTQSLQAAATGLLMVAWIAGVRSPEVYVGLSMVAGAFGGLNLPAWKAFINDLVDRDLLLNAITLGSMQFNAARMFGPALAGITLAAAGPAWAFFVNFASFGAVLLALWLIDVRTGPTGGAREPFSPIRDFGHTLRWIRTHTGIRRAILTVGVVGLLGMPIQVLAVVFAEDVFGRGATAYGLMLTMIGLGAVVTGPFVAGRGSRMARSQLEAIALVIYSIGVLAFAMAPSIVVAFAALLLVGAAHLTSASVLNTAVQIQVPEDRRAKVLSVHMMVVTFSSPLGQLVLGQVMEWTSPRATMLGAGVAMAMISGFLITSGRLRSLDADGEPVISEAGG